MVKYFLIFGDVNQLGQEIRFLRTHIGYSSEMFAHILGLDKTSLSRIENSRSKVSNQVSYRLGSLLCSSEKFSF